MAQRGLDRGTQAPVDFGLLRRRGEPGPCGLCGQVTSLSKAHVPPRCSGNDHGVQRRYFQVIGGDEVVPHPKPFRGGLYVYGLCGVCNGAAGSGRNGTCAGMSWDQAYAELSAGLRSCWVVDDVVIPGNRMVLPPVDYWPSAVARSVLMGLFGVNHVLRERFPDLAAGLLAGAEPLSLPSDLRLRVALARGKSGWLTGAIHTQQVIGPTSTGGQLSLLSDAAVYFPPLAWQLASPGSTLLDEQGWADASSWLAIPLAERRNVHDLCRSLPLVREPGRDPAIQDRIVRLVADRLAPMVECYGLAP